VKAIYRKTADMPFITEGAKHYRKYLKRSCSRHSTAVQTKKSKRWSSRETNNLCELSKLCNGNIDELAKYFPCHPREEVYNKWKNSTAIHPLRLYEKIIAILLHKETGTFNKVSEEQINHRSMEAIKGFFYRTKTKTSYKQKVASIKEETLYEEMIQTALNDHVSNNELSFLEEELDDLSKNIGKYAVRLNTSICIEIFCNVVSDFKSIMKSKHKGHQASHQTDIENSLTNVMIVYAHIMRNKPKETADTSDKDFSCDVSPSNVTTAYDGFCINDKDEKNATQLLFDAFLV
jgi:hypothetical protein